MSIPWLPRICTYHIYPHESIYIWGFRGEYRLERKAYFILFENKVPPESHP